MSDDNANLAPTEPDEKKPEPMLTAIEARVLGALMEKQMTTPDLYPLTQNSLVTACNQKTSREPVMNLQNGAVQQCLNKLEERHLVDVEYGSRANKYKQKLSKVMMFDKAEQALFCLMLLRGPQTVNELLSRSNRMHNFAGGHEIEDILDAHLGKLNPLIVRIPAQAGQREDRYTHMLCGEPNVSYTTTPSTHAPRVAMVNETNEDIDELKARVDALEKKVSWLLEQLGEEMEQEETE